MFRKKFNRKIEEGIPTYEEFLKKNTEALSGEGIIIPAGIGHKVSTRAQIRKMAAVTAASLIFVFVAGFFLFSPFFKNEPTDHETFAENDLKPVTDKNNDNYKKEYRVLSLLSDYDIRQYIWSKTGEPAWLMCDGEYETEKDFYIISVNIRLDERYNFIDQPLYDRLAETIAIGDKLFYYEKNPADDGVYDCRIRYKENGSDVYISVSCSKGNLVELFENI